MSNIIFNEKGIVVFLSWYDKVYIYMNISVRCQSNTLKFSPVLEAHLKFFFHKKTINRYCFYLVRSTSTKILHLLWAQKVVTEWFSNIFINVLFLFIHNISHTNNKTSLSLRCIHSSISDLKQNMTRRQLDVSEKIGIVKNIYRLEYPVNVQRLWF